jgi:hypothetical protein
MTRKEEILEAAHKSEYPENVPYFVNGAEWADSTAWKPADGDILPEIDREVIALVEQNGYHKVVYAHRPPEYWDGKDILTGKITTYFVERYDKGGWNQPGVKWWLDLDLPHN